jgi:hypothetical protein
MFFGISFTLFFFQLAINFISKLGMLEPLKGIMPEKDIRILLFLGILFVIFAIFSALKVLGQTIWEMGLLFFSKDEAGADLIVSKKISYLFVIGGLISVPLNSSILISISVLGATFIAYMIYFLIKQSKSFSVVGMFGFVLFQLIIWGSIGSGFAYIYFTLVSTYLKNIPF